MGSTFHGDGKFRAPKSLQLSHDEVRAGFVRATMGGGPIAAAAKRLAKISLPHFDGEEKFVFPVLGLLPDLKNGFVQQEMADLLPLIADFRTRFDSLEKQHESIRSAIENLLEASHRSNNREVAKFAYNLRIHERIEDEVIFPAVMLIGNYLRERLAV